MDFFIQMKQKIVKVLCALYAQRYVRNELWQFQMKLTSVVLIGEAHGYWHDD